MQLIEELKKLREDRRVPQTEVAAACGVDQSAVSLWEQGRTKPSGSARILLEQFIERKRSEAA